MPAGISNGVYENSFTTCDQWKEREVLAEMEGKTILPFFTYPSQRLRRL
jgi:hypothetical protein